MTYARGLSGRAAMSDQGLETQPERLAWQKLKDLRKSSEAASEEMSQGLEKAWNELGTAVEKAFSKFE